MNKELIPTEDFLKALSGKFDLDIIFHVELIGKNISKLGAIPQCSNIMLLNLSKNKLLQINSLGNLVNLTFLNLSYNLITSIDCIDNLILLRHLELQGNNIMKITPSKMSKLVRLEKLKFQIVYSYKENKSTEQNDSNPICKEKDYRKNILHILPKLNYLDGISRETEVLEFIDEDDFAQIEKKINPDNFKFDYSNKMKFDPNELITQKDITNTKKIIDDKYKEFKKEITALQSSLKEIK